MKKAFVFKNKLLAGLLVACTMLSAVGCTTNPEQGETNPGTVTDPTNNVVEEPPVEVPEGAGNVIEINGMKAIGEREEVNGLFQSYLTGEWKKAEIAKRRPMAVMVPNNKSALPQYGISQASIIFEAPMEYNSCTRLMCVFEDYDNLDHIGSVRSSRLYFLYPAMAWDAIYCNWGLAVPLVGPLINSDRVDNISQAVYGIDNPSAEAFERDEKREAAGYATEYTGILTIKGYNAAVTRQGYRTNYNDGYEPMLQFAADDTLVTYDDNEDAKKISPGGIEDGKSGGGYESSKAYFVYNEEDHLYYRYQFGEPQIDEMTGEQLTCTNVIFMSTWGTYVTEDSGYLAFEMDKGGLAYVFTNGKYVPAVWSKGSVITGSQSDQDQYHFYSIYGGELVMNQGKTWICLVWDESLDLITIE